MEFRPERGRRQAQANGNSKSEWRNSERRGDDGLGGGGLTQRSQRTQRTASLMFARLQLHSLAPARLRAHRARLQRKDGALGQHALPTTTTATPSGGIPGPFDFG